jgi:hypothetical protein
MEEARSRISQDIIRSFRKHLNEDVMFMCFYMGKTDGGIVTDERPFSGRETIDLFSSVISAAEDYIVPAIMYSLFNVYGPIKVFDIVKDYSRGFDMRGPFTTDPDTGTSVPPASDS